MREREEVSIQPARKFTGTKEQERELVELEERAERAVRALQVRKLEPLRVSGVVEGHYRAKAGEFVRVRRAGSSFDVFLPAPSQAIAGQHLIVKDINGGSGTITLRVTGAKVDGSSTTTITTAYGAKHLVCDGENWWSV